MKTAVKELYERLWETNKDKFTWIAILDDILGKEKKQIINAYKEGCSDSILDESTDEERAEEYYNETYGDKKQLFTTLKYPQHKINLKIHLTLGIFFTILSL